MFLMKWVTNSHESSVWETSDKQVYVNFKSQLWVKDQRNTAFTAILRKQTEGPAANTQHRLIHYQRCSSGQHSLSCDSTTET